MPKSHLSYSVSYETLSASTEYSDGVRFLNGSNLYVRTFRQCGTQHMLCWVNGKIKDNFFGSLAGGVVPFKRNGILIQLVEDIRFTLCDIAFDRPSYIFYPK